MRWIVAVVLLAISVPSYPLDMANFGTARGLSDSCNAMLQVSRAELTNPIAPEDEGAFFAASGMCLGFIQGFRNGLYYAYSLGLSPSICLPDGVTDDQIARVLIKKVEQNPEIEHLKAGPFLAVTLSATWPCPKEK